MKKINLYSKTEYTLKLLGILFFVIIEQSIHAVTIVGIAGGTASGKTTLVKKIQETFPDKITIIAQDSYYCDMSHLPLQEKRKLNFDHPDAINFQLLIDQLLDLKAGQAVVGRNYSFVTLVNEEGDTIPATDVIIVEGILLFAVPELRDLLDIKIYIDTDGDVRLSRRLLRDHVAYGRPYHAILSSWIDVVKPMHNQFVAPGKEFADIVINGNKNTDMAVEIVSLLIQSRS